MRVLVVGAGGREHALVWALAASPLLTKLWCAPGNPGTARLAENVPIGALDIAALVEFARANGVDLVVPGPEAPLIAGIADAMAAAGVACCGPSGAAARLEGSKAFAKEVCDAAGIPTARWEAFDEPAAARAFVRRRGAPVVVKADGLAAGKGVVVAQTTAEAEAAIRDFLEVRRLGEAGARLVIEEALEGEEVSLFALCDGAHAIGFGAAADHKRLGEGDIGPNTGGMGAISPPPGFGPAEQAAAMSAIVRPALAELARRGRPFRGFLFAGLMLTAEGPKLLEFNVRLGDPEAQCLLPRLHSDLLAALLAACDGELGAFDLRWRELATIAVVLAAKGYPAAPLLHAPLGSLAAAEAAPDTLIFHAGTEEQDGRLVSAGGRVLTVCGSGADFVAAHAAAYRALAMIDWPDGYFRRDIGWRALAAEGARAMR
jgi:phosphoribosylamine--glycine ligase